MSLKEKTKKLRKTPGKKTLVITKRGPSKGIDILKRKSGKKLRKS